MPNAIGWIALAIASATIGAVLADLRGRRTWMQVGTSIARTELQASAERITRARAEAYERAAEAVALWPHRIDKKADLARHLLSLATAPALGNTPPNPESEPQEEPLPSTASASPS